MRAVRDTLVFVGPLSYCELYLLSCEMFKGENMRTFFDTLKCWPDASLLVGLSLALQDVNQYPWPLPLGAGSMSLL